MQENPSEELIDAENEINVPEQELYQAFFTKSTHYYLKRLTKIVNQKEIVLFNPFAFFFGFFWMAYRKMYIEIIIFLFFVAFFETILEMFIDLSGADRIFAIIYASILGLVRNYFYLLKAKRRVKKASDLFTDTDNKIRYLHKKGGVSYIAPVVFLLLAVALYIIGDELSSNSINYGY